MSTPEPSRKLSDSHYKLIGEVAAEWAFLESQIDLGLWGFMGLTHEIGKPITSYAHIGTRLELTRKYAERYGVAADQLEFLDKLSVTIKAALTKRNNIVHAVWYALPDPSYTGFAVVQKRGQFRSSVQDMKEWQIEGVVTEIQALSQELIAWLSANAPYPRDA